jgi:DHA1 family multidrug resistance protein-like MFS transporter
MNKKAFVVLVGSMFISMLGMGIVSPFLPIYANKLGASSLQVGLVQAGFNLTGIGTLLFIGRLSDRFGRKPFLSTGLSIIALSSVGLMFAKTPVHLILWRPIWEILLRREMRESGWELSTPFSLPA